METHDSCFHGAPHPPEVADQVVELVRGERERGQDETRSGAEEPKTSDPLRRQMNFPQFGFCLFFFNDSSAELLRLFRTAAAALQTV